MAKDRARFGPEDDLTLDLPIKFRRPERTSSKMITNACLARGCKVVLDMGYTLEDHIASCSQNPQPSDGFCAYCGAWKPNALGMCGSCGRYPNNPVSMWPGDEVPRATPKVDHPEGVSNGCVVWPGTNKSRDYHAYPCPEASKSQTQVVTWNDFSNDEERTAYQPIDFNEMLYWLKDRLFNAIQEDINMALSHGEDWREKYDGDTIVRGYN